MEKQETQSEYETETLHVPCSIRLAAWIWDVDSGESRHGPTASFSHEGTTAHPEHKVVWLRHQWFRSEPDKADVSTPHHSRQKTLIARTCLPPTTRRASPQYPPALCQPFAGQGMHALPPTGSVHLVGQGRPGYNKWKRITGAQSTRCGHRRRIARCRGRYDPCWSSAAVSKWVVTLDKALYLYLTT